MKINLDPDLTDFVNVLAAKNGITPEEMVAQIIMAEHRVVESKVGRITAKVNLAVFDKTKFISHVDQGKEARVFFKLNELDARKGPFVVHVPDDMPTLSLKFFTGMFDESIMMLGPKKFRDHYVFDADTSNLLMIDRYVRTVWEKTKDVFLFRISMTTVGKFDANFCVWLKIRDEVSLAVIDETDVGDYDRYQDALLYIEERGRLVEQAVSPPY